MGSTGGATLHDPSAAISLLWLRRTLHFTLAIMENLLTNKQKADDEAALLPLTLLDADDDSELPPAESDPTMEAVRGAYNEVMRPFHGWLLRKTCDLVFNQVPTLDEAIAMLGPGLGEAEREAMVFNEIRMFLAEGREIAAALDAIFDDLQLEDLRRRGREGSHPLRECGRRDLRRRAAS